jgi:CubicO group peptidase (beta-lactamase class C family)
MRRRNFLRALALLPVSGCARIGTGNGSQSPGPDAFGQLAALVPELRADFDVPGVSIAHVQRGQLVWTRGFGVKDSVSKMRVDAETLFEAASVSKTAFACAALKLCERGIIDLDIPLSATLRRASWKGTRGWIRSPRDGYFRIPPGWRYGGPTTLC